MPCIRTEGIQIGYETAGSGHPLLLIAGVGYGRWFWRRVVPGLAGGGHAGPGGRAGRQPRHLRSNAALTTSLEPRSFTYPLQTALRMNARMALQCQALLPRPACPCSAPPPVW